MVNFVPQPGANYKYDYLDIFKSVAAGRIKSVPTYREMCKKDLFFVLFFGLQREDVNEPFIVNAIREVEEDHEDTLDLWAREHYKSTILTYGLPIQEIIINPEERIGIFSHTRPIAKGFLRQIKHSLEATPPIKRWFPDIFYTNPKSQAPKWSEDDGLIVKRKSHPKESTVEAWGLVDGQPTSKHFTIRIYDDVVTEDGVGTPAMITKTIKAYELSQSLGTVEGHKRMCGTHYHHADLYMHNKAKAQSYEIHGVAQPKKVKVSHGYKVREKPATHDGTATGKPVFLSEKRVRDLRFDQSSYIFSCQQLLTPATDEEKKFKKQWLRFYDKLPEHLNKYLLVDPANEKNKQSDFTFMCVIGVDPFNHRFVLDMLRRQLNLGERWVALRDMWLKWAPIEATGYEKYGKDADINYMEEKQQKEGIYFGITPLGGKVGKDDRILRLVPRFEKGEIFLPHRLIDPETGEDMVKVFIEEEYDWWPYAGHDDMLDGISRIEDEKLGVIAPVGYQKAAAVHESVNEGHNLSWMGN